MVSFCHSDPILVTGDVEGDVNVYRLTGYEDCNPKVQKDNLLKLMGPKKKGGNENESNEWLLKLYNNWDMRLFAFL